MKSWLQDIDVEMYSTHNEESVLFLKDFLEPWRTKFTNVWLQYQKNVCWQIRWHFCKIFAKG